MAVFYVKHKIYLDLRGFTDENYSSGRDASAERG